MNMPRIRQQGASLIEVLVTIVILAFGLLGLAGLQSRLQMSDTESYQHAQALVLLEDMANRVASNRALAVDYVTGAGSPLGAGMTCPTAVGTRQEIDALQWCHSLQGAAEVSGGVNRGAMIGARGCVEALPDDEYLITVAWQGLGQVAAPPGAVACGAGQYDSGTTCTADRCRRVATTIVRIADLS